MAKGTDFGGVHSSRDLHLMQAKVEVQPAKPKTKFIDIPGADGSKDYSESPAGRVVYSTRKITWTYKLYPGDNWVAKYTEVSNAINGLNCQIRLDDDPDYFYLGRVSVDKYDSDSILHTITVTATCQPYKVQAVTESFTITTEDTIFSLLGGKMPVVPTITVTKDTTLVWAGSSYSLSAGTHKLLDVVITEGINNLMARVTTGTGTIRFKYQRGEL